jgi:hypothetical protein
MTDKEKYLLLAGLAASALAYWYFGVHVPAAADIVAQPSVPVAALPGTSPAAGITAPPPVGTSTTASGQDSTQLSALLAWAQKTQNPSLYAQMVNALTPTQLDSLYQILTMDWNVPGASPTLAMTTFWNGLRAQYPFLNTGGVGCSNFNCTS